MAQFVNERGLCVTPLTHTHTQKHMSTHMQMNCTLHPHTNAAAAAHTLLTASAKCLFQTGWIWPMLSLFLCSDYFTAELD